MPRLKITRNYKDDADLKEDRKLKAAFQAIEHFFNGQGVGSDNLAINSIATNKLKDGAVTRNKKETIEEKVTGSSGSFTLSNTISTAESQQFVIPVVTGETDRPVVHGLIGDGANESYVGVIGAAIDGAQAQFDLERTSGPSGGGQIFIGTGAVVSAEIRIPPGCLDRIDNVGSDTATSVGNNTYRLLVRSTSAAMTAVVRNARSIGYKF